MKIKAKIGETSYTLEVESSEILIEELKKQLEGLSGVSYLCQKWIFQGKIIGDKLTLGSTSIKDESCVIVMKTAMPPNSTPSITVAAPVPVVGEQTTYINAPLAISTPYIPVQVNTESFDRSMYELLNNSEEIVEGAVTLLLKIATNIIQFPNEEKFRRLGNANPAFSKKIGTVKGGPQCMNALGFVLQGTDWVLFPSEAAWEVLVQCKAKLDKFVNKLKETSNLKVAGPSAAISSPSSSGAATNGQSAAPAVDNSAAAILAVQQLIQAMQRQQQQQPSSSPSEINSSNPAVDSSEQFQMKSESESLPTQTPTEVPHAGETGSLPTELSADADSSSEQKPNADV